MKTAKKILALTLALAMVFTLCVPAFAESTPPASGKIPYKYVSLGASNTLGYGLHGYWPLPLYDDPSAVFRDFPEDIEEIMIARDGYFTSGYYYYSDDAYPVLVKNALQEKLGDGYEVSLKQCAINSMRAYDLMYMLDEDWAADAYIGWRLGDGTEGWRYDIERERHQTISVPGYDDIVIDKGETDLRAEIKDAVLSADFITYDLGANDFGSYLLSGMLVQQKFDCDLNNVTDGYAEYFYVARDAIKNAIVKLTGDAISLELMDTVNYYIDSIAYAYLGFIVSFDKSMEIIYRENPDVDMVVLSIGNFLYDTTVTLGGIKIPIGDTLNVAIDLANAYTALYSPYHNNYTYANVSTDGHVEYFRDKMLEWNGNPEDLHFCIKDAFCGYDYNFISGYVTKVVLDSIGVTPDSPNYNELYQKGLNAQLYALGYFCKTALEDKDMVIDDLSVITTDFITPMINLCYGGENSVLVQALLTDDSLDEINARTKQYIDENLLYNDSMTAAAFIYVYFTFAACFFSHPSYQGHLDIETAVMDAYENNISGYRAVGDAVDKTVENIVIRTLKQITDAMDSFISKTIDAIGLRSYVDSIIDLFNRLSGTAPFIKSGLFVS